MRLFSKILIIIFCACITIPPLTAQETVEIKETDILHGGREDNDETASDRRCIVYYNHPQGINCDDIKEEGSPSGTRCPVDQTCDFKIDLTLNQKVCTCVKK